MEVALAAGEKNFGAGGNEEGRGRKGIGADVKSSKKGVWV